MEGTNQLTYFGLLLIIIGLFFVLTPLLIRSFPNIEKIPWFILWIYKTDGFTFATSPILIIISLISFILYYLKR
ncbi:hypothetical protein JW865_01405 [Candidatus Bathyarchaeota archaeon]|nr:hypothetical protein [Candidatus Bathyarchaeota archaeon]